jgi:hypothetical protein
MEDKGMPHELREQLRRYYMETAKLNRFEEDKAILQQLSPMLQGKISMHLHHHWIEKVWYLRHISDKDMIIGISRRLKTMVFAPSEEIFFDRTLFIVRRGLCIRKRRILFNGDIWGEDMVLSNEHLRDRCLARSVNHLEVIMLEFGDLSEVVQADPVALQRLRVTQVTIATKAAFVRIAECIKQLESDGVATRTSLTKAQRLRLVEEVLNGTFSGSIPEEKETRGALELQMEQCMQQAKRNLTDGVVDIPSPKKGRRPSQPMDLTPPPMADDLSEGSSDDSMALIATGARTPDDAVASNAMVIELVKELAMKVDCLLLKDQVDKTPTGARRMIDRFWQSAPSNVDSAAQGA